MNFSCKVVLSTFLHIAKFVPAVETMFGVVEFYLACELVTHSPHEKRVELVTLVVEGYFTSILELYSFVTVHV